MNNWKVIPTIVIATVLIFGAGVFTGGMLVNYVKQARPKVVKRTPPPVSLTNGAASATNPPLVKPPKLPEVLSKDFLQRLDTELHLSAEQREAVQKIINEGQNQVRKTIQDARLEIRETLTPEQMQQFDELLKRSFKRPIFPTNAPAATLPKPAPAP